MTVIKHTKNVLQNTSRVHIMYQSCLKQLDLSNLRETNLKVRQPLPETAAMQETEEALGDFDGMLPMKEPHQFN